MFDVLSTATASLSKSTRLIINLRTCEVRCPKDGADVCVLDVCIDKMGVGNCSFYRGLLGTSSLCCAWPMEGKDGQG